MDGELTLQVQSPKKTDMQYLFEIFIPVLILVMSYVFAKTKPKIFSEWISLSSKTLLHEWGYTFFVYYLDTEKGINTGWAFVALLLLLIPMTIIVFLLKLFYWLRAKTAKRP